MGLICFLVSVFRGQTFSEDSCAALALFTHYFHLSQFSWMFIQAVNFWQVLVMNDEHTERRYLLYFLLGWGLPAVVMMLLVIVLLGGFGWNIHGVYGLFPPYGSASRKHHFRRAGSEATPTSSRKKSCFMPNIYAALCTAVLVPLMCLVVVLVVFIHAYQVTSQWKAYDDIYRGRTNSTVGHPQCKQEGTHTAVALASHPASQPASRGDRRIKTVDSDDQSILILIAMMRMMREQGGATGLVEQEQGGARGLVEQEQGGARGLVVEQEQEQGGARGLQGWCRPLLTGCGRWWKWQGEVPMVLYLFALVSLVWLWAGLHMGYRDQWMLILYVIFNCLLVSLLTVPSRWRLGTREQNRRHSVWNSRFCCCCCCCCSRFRFGSEVLSYLTIFHALRYHNIMTMHRAVAILTVIWTACGASAVLMVRFFETTFIMTAFIGVFGVTLLLIIFLYLYMKKMTTNPWAKK
ncbi:hypothetical protein CRUP_038334 [Coryphaenoides rupestris]|nr:hypothetical protein CRUP_038334 [Coryphaenoides rupestris]